MCCLKHASKNKTKKCHAHCHALHRSQCRCHRRQSLETTKTISQKYQLSWIPQHPEDVGGKKKKQGKNRKVTVLLALFLFFLLNKNVPVSAILRSSSLNNGTELPSELLFSKWYQYLLTNRNLCIKRAAILRPKMKYLWWSQVVSLNTAVRCCRRVVILFCTGFVRVLRSSNELYRCFPSPVCQLEDFSKADLQCVVY